VHKDWLLQQPSGGGWSVMANKHKAKEEESDRDQIRIRGRRRETRNDERELRRFGARAPFPSTHNTPKAGARGLHL
jgi:hypothetical protein